MYMCVPGPIDISSQSKHVFIAISKRCQLPQISPSIGRKHVLGPPMNLGVLDDEPALLVEWRILILKRYLEVERGSVRAGSTDNKPMFR
jgi:hypothetical protein